MYETETEFKQYSLVGINVFRMDVMHDPTLYNRPSNIVALKTRKARETQVRPIRDRISDDGFLEPAKGVRVEVSVTSWPSNNGEEEVNILD